MDPECSKLLNGKAKDLNPLGQKTAAVDMKIDSPDAEHPPRTMGYEVSKQVYEINMRDNNASPSRASEANHQSEEILQLKTKNKKLEYDLDKSERLRFEIQAKLNALLGKDNQGNILQKLMNLKRTHYLGVQQDEKAGLLWNLTDKIEEFKIWDRWLSQNGAFLSGRN